MSLTFGIYAAGQVGQTIGAPDDRQAIDRLVSRLQGDQPFVVREYVHYLGASPDAERVAVLGLLNKRNGIVRDIQLRPGQAIRVRDAVVRLRACESSAPWENERLTGAFVQLDVEQADNRWRRVFSGWLFKESPSLNVVEHPVYDVWPKSCAMTHPEGGTPAPASRPGAASSRSSASNSTGPAAAAPAEAPATPPARPEPSPSADANSAR